MIDVGGGASTLVDDLLARGVMRVTVLDLSAQALAVARERLGARADAVAWLAADLLEAPLPEAGFDLWHDRAVLHFLVDADAAARYARQAAHAIAPGGHAVIGGFAPDGPERCSGLTVARRSADDIAARARKAAEAAVAEATAEGKSKREELVEAARKDIEVETRRSLEQIRKEVADLTVLATEKVTRKSLDEADQRKLVEDALGEVDFSALAGKES